MEPYLEYEKKKREMKKYFKQLNDKCKRHFGPLNKYEYPTENPYQSYKDVLTYRAKVMKLEEEDKHIKKKGVCKLLRSTSKAMDPTKRYYVGINSKEECDIVKGKWSPNAVNRTNKFDDGICWVNDAEKTCGEGVGPDMLRSYRGMYNPNISKLIIDEANKCNKLPGCSWKQQTAYTYDCVRSQKEDVKKDEGPVEVPPEDMPLVDFEKYLEDWYINKKHGPAPKTTSLFGKGDRCKNIPPEEEEEEGALPPPPPEKEKYISYRSLNLSKQEDLEIVKKAVEKHYNNPEDILMILKAAWEKKKKLSEYAYERFWNGDDPLEGFYTYMDSIQFQKDYRVGKRPEGAEKPKPKMYPSIPQSVVNMIMKNVAMKKGKKRGLLAYHSTGSGKCSKKDTPIVMYDGTIKMVQDITIGELVMGDDSTPRKVISLGRGEDNMYEIIPDDGTESYTVNSEHILVLKDDKSQLHHIEVKDYIEKNLSMKGYRVPVEYKKPYLPSSDPYKIGSELVDNIPADLMKMSKTDRIMLLNGILQKYDDRLYETNEIFAKQIVFLARSVGFFANYKDQKIIVEYNKPLEYNITVKHVGWDNYYGFTLDGNHRYLLGDFSVTHNTCTAAGVMDSFWDSDYHIVFASSIDGVASNPDFVFHQCCLNILPRFQKEPYKGATDAQSLALIGSAFKKRGVRFLSFAKLANRVMKAIEYKKLNKLDGYDVIKKRGGNIAKILASDDYVDLDKTILIIDEVDQIFNPLPNQKKQHEFLEAELDPKKHPNLKVVILTATPGSTIPDILKLLNIVRDTDAPEIKPFDVNKPETIERFRQSLRGMISYLDMSADDTKFPIVKDSAPVKLPMSHTQFEKYVEAYKAVKATQKDYKKLVKKNEVGKYWEPARKYANMLFNMTKDMKLEDFSSKLPYVIDNILKYPDEKHYLYSAFGSKAGYGGHGVIAVAKELEKQGYVKLSVKEAKKINKTGKLPLPAKRYILVINTELSEEGGNAGANLHELIKIYNHPENKDGQLIHVMLASNKFYSALDLKSTNNVHLLESLVTMAFERQALGRAVRFCSFAQKDRSKGEWVVKIHRYISDKPEPIVIDLSEKRTKIQKEISEIEVQIEEAGSKEALKEAKKAAKDKEKEITKLEKLVAKGKATEEELNILKEELKELEESLASAEKGIEGNKDLLASLKAQLKEKSKELKQLDKPPKNNPNDVEMIEERIQKEAQERFRELQVVYACMKEAAVDCRLLKEFHEKTAKQNITCV